MNDPTPRHPAGSRLDAMAIGGGDEETRAHTASCAVCQAYVNAIAKGAEGFAANEGLRADAFVQAVRRRQAAQNRSRFAWAGGAASILALAAGVILFVRDREAPQHGDRALGVEPGNGLVRFKGGVQVAIIVEHGGTQSREHGDLVLEPGDRIRLEVALDRDVRLVAGVLAESGEWAELQPAALLGSGTHYSERSITFDDEVPSGWVLVGSEDAVAQARSSRDFHEVAAIVVRQKHP